MAVPTVLRVELLGGFRVLTDGRSAARLPSARQQQLIAFLILHARSVPIQRQRIAGSLWPESSDAQALTNLRRELHHLRDARPRLDALVDAGSRTLAWRGEADALVDLVAFEAAADRGLAGDCAALRERHGCIKATSSPTARASGLTPTANVSVNVRGRFWPALSASSNTIGPSGMRSSMPSSCSISIRSTKRHGVR